MTNERLEATAENLIAHDGERVEFTFEDGMFRIGRIQVAETTGAKGDAYLRFILKFRTRALQIYPGSGHFTPKGPRAS